MSTSPTVPSVHHDQHKGSKSDFGGDVDVEVAIDRSGCSVEYYHLEDCLGENERDWRKCQEEVKTLRLCSEENQKQTRRTS
ncbi:unnamed protein product [Choristocarpus tenellus]